MPLDLKKLTQLVDLAEGVKRARCPACAENGQDKAGEHLRIYADGRFGCCVFPGDREHRKRIFALAGERVRQAIKVRVAPAKPAGPVAAVQSGILGRLGRVFSGQATDSPARDAGDGVNEVKTEFSADQLSGTAGTGVSNSEADSALELPFSLSQTGDSGTPGTGFKYSRVYAEKVSLEEGVQVNIYKEFCRSVPGVPERKGEEGLPKPAVKQGRMPYFTPDGTLSIPFDSPERFHWWKGGQSVKETIAEVRSWTATEGKDQNGTPV